MAEREMMKSYQLSVVSYQLSVKAKKENFYRERTQRTQREK